MVKKKKTVVKKKKVAKKAVKSNEVEIEKVPAPVEAKAPKTPKKKKVVKKAKVEEVEAPVEESEAVEEKAEDKSAMGFLTMRDLMDVKDASNAKSIAEANLKIKEQDVANITLELKYMADVTLDSARTQEFKYQKAYEAECNKTNAVLNRIREEYGINCDDLKINTANGRILEK